MKLYGFFVIALTLTSLGVNAGGLFLCDNYGHSCIAPSPSCKNLIPPIHAMNECSDDVGATGSRTEFFIARGYADRFSNQDPRVTMYLDARKRCGRQGMPQQVANPSAQILLVNHSTVVLSIAPFVCVPR
jgi:hypothetical protein